jgi:hypothetical protein
MTVLGVIRDDLLRIDDPKVDAMEPGTGCYIRSADDADE